MAINNKINNRGKRIYKEEVEEVNRYNKKQNKLSKIKKKAI